MRDATIGTFHSVAFGLLRQRWADLGVRERSLLVNRRALLEQAVSAATEGDGVGFPSRSSAPSSTGSGPATCRSRPIRTRLAPRRPLASAAALVVETAAQYHTLKRRRGVVDFDDLLEGVREELERDPDFAAQLHWRFRHFFVDEFQDVNPLQHALLEGWRGGRNDLCLVGDPRQAIYGWNGAEPTLLDRVDSTYPGVRIIRLVNNYRCAPSVVEAAATVLGRSGGDDTVAVRPPLGGIQIEATTDEAGEAATIAAWLRSHHLPGVHWRSMAVLARTNQQLEALDAALAQQGIPVASARAADTDDDAEVARLLGTARRLPSAEQLVAWGRDLDEVADDAPLDPAARARWLARRRVAAGVQRFVRIVPRGTGGGFAEWFEVSGGGIDQESTADAVALLTFHAAKGREWRSVAIAGVEAGLVPHSTARTPEAAAEEIRLLYVAMTRASDHLLVTWAAERNRRPARRSALLDGIVSTSTPFVPAPPPPRVHRTIAAERLPALVVLEAWRGRAARAAGVAPARSWTIPRSIGSRPSPRHR
ncbi:MAG: ATP-dependent helicase [Ilumatobacteraceae bacterium]